MSDEFVKTYTLRTSDFNCDKVLRPSSVFDLFQDAAGIHSDLLGCGLNQFKEKGIAWVLVGVRYRIEKTVEMYSDLTVRTWPLKPSFVKYQREFSVTKNGETVIKGQSMWSIIDLKTRKLSVQKDVYPDKLDFKEEKSFEGRFLKISLPRDDEFSYVSSVTAKNSDIDVNGHVNNVRYLNYVTDVIGMFTEDYKYVSAEYSKELLLGDKVDLYSARKGNVLFVKGIIDGVTAFAVQYGE